MNLFGRFKERGREIQELRNAPKGEAHAMLKNVMDIASQAPPNVTLISSMTYGNEVVTPAFFKAKDAFFPPEYRDALAARGITVSHFMGRTKLELYAEIRNPRTTRPTLSRQDPKDQMIRIMVRYRTPNDSSVIEMMQGGADWPIKTYPLPPTVEEARQKIRELIDQESPS